MANQFYLDFPFAGEIYIDPSLQSYQKFSLPRGIAATLLPNSHWFSMLKSAAKNPQVSQKGVQGDALQQGGTFVIGPGEKMLFSHINQGTGDHADIKEILKALQQ
mmetsp:Transcript_6137/g.8562  ORF Transcript_6137/g.8562 Transcript_6137/m.8562 type:complete len:105 (+) Transcript_6137:419-733(+)|eukprot:CAMPEP_0168562690 /NCGR_PEP_ID=MMETSP0413-20121227/12265_1 /TAXON_ID=136452 /ORGANISM="Filamoeba nolandi, Strain NC-AS-23-1" /LENGTH=104 /DNA_ID=CAMNT_0008594149 /DNA_START=355 /DNA_END=669 /DNA_ORIENTATION=-